LRYFLLSNRTLPVNSTNRKRVVFDDKFQYKDETIFIQQGRQGAYAEILNSMFEQFDTALNIHKRILLHRFDLHPTYNTLTNALLSKFIDRLKKWIGRNYGIRNIGYIWVREQERAKKQHYHLALFLDGNRIRHPKKLNAQIKEMWTPYGHMPTIINPYYFVDKNNQGKRLDALYRVSYFAKVRGKGYRDSQTKDYSTSRLKIR